jgi:CRP-like cAMP-binding protein
LKKVAKLGSRSNLAGRPVNNEILLCMSAREFKVIRSHLEYIAMPQHRVLHQPHTGLEFLYFPDHGLISLVVVLKNGKTVEAAIVGREGASGTAIAAGVTRSSLREIVQISGAAFRIKRSVFQRLLPNLPELRAALNHYIVLLSMQIAQTAACNRLHEIEQRLARWLLMAEDCAASPTLHITHDFLATMLGTDRPSVTLAAGLLQKAGLIKYSRASVRITNRPQLEEFACECYSVIGDYAMKCK